MKEGRRPKWCRLFVAVPHARNLLGLVTAGWHRFCFDYTTNFFFFFKSICSDNLEII